MPGAPAFPNLTLETGQESQSEQRQLRFGVQYDDTWSAWHTACVDAMQKQGNAVPIALIGPPRPLKRPAELPTSLRAVPTYRPSAGAEYDELDFVLSFASPHATALLPTAVWSVRFVEGNVDDWAASPAGRHGETAIVELVVTHSGSATVLHSAEIKAGLTLTSTLRLLRTLAPAVCVGACRRISDTKPRRTNLPRPHFDRPLRTTSVLRAVRGGADALIARLFLREEWSIGLLSVSMEAVIEKQSLPVPTWLPPPRFGYFHADPFPVVINGKAHILFEMWSMFRGRGWIAAMPLAQGSDPADARPVIDIGCHASYPATFTFEGTTFCVPEMWEAGGISIFRLNTESGRWLLVKKCLEGIPVVDPTIFFYNDNWWLLGTIRGKAPNVDLYAWYAPSPVGPWTPHPHNPVKSNVRSSRPAGAVFNVGETLYRPAQDCSAGYGSALTFNRVLRLDRQEFAEEEVTQMVPDRSWRFPDGLHTVNRYEGGLVIDSKRLVFDPTAAFWALIPHFRRRWKRRTQNLPPSGRSTILHKVER